MQVIKLIQLEKKYKNITAVKNLNLEITQGELVALLGVNGAGKTTTIKILSCLTKPTRGDALIYGHSVLTEPEKVKKLIGISPQETAVAPNLSVKENLELICGIHGFSLILLFLLSTMQKNIPVHLFEINTLTPGITVFGLSFSTLFSATLLARDRESALLQRLYTTPLTSLDFMLGYMLPIFIFTFIFLFSYLAIWIIIYSLTKKNTKAINEKLPQSLPLINNDNYTAGSLMIKRRFLFI